MSRRIDWNLRMVGSREARRLLPQQPGGTRRVDWRGTLVGHLDTGYTEHPVFGDWGSGRQWLRVADGFNFREQGSPPRDPLDYEGNPGHGTRTASVLCGDLDPPVVDNGISSEIGVAPRLPVVPCRIVNRVALTPERNRFAVARGIRHCADMDCQVISISLGMPFFLPGQDGGLGRTVDRAYEDGIIIVAAAGQVIDSVTYPGKYRRTIGVGGVTWQRRVWFTTTPGWSGWTPGDRLRTCSERTAWLPQASPEWSRSRAMTRAFSPWDQARMTGKWTREAARPTLRCTSRPPLPCGCSREAAT